VKTVHAIRVEVIEIDVTSAGKTTERRSTLSHYEGGWPADRVDGLFNKLADLITAERKTLNVSSTRRPLKSDAAKGVRARRARL
jgi:hypothetical protein